MCQYLEVTHRCTHKTIKLLDGYGNEKYWCAKLKKAHGSKCTAGYTTKAGQKTDIMRNCSKACEHFTQDDKQSWLAAEKGRENARKAAEEEENKKKEEEEEEERKKKAEKKNGKKK